MVALQRFFESCRPMRPLPSPLNVPLLLCLGMIAAECLGELEPVAGEKTGETQGVEHVFLAQRITNERVRLLPEHCFFYGDSKKLTLSGQTKSPETDPMTLNGRDAGDRHFWPQTDTVAVVGLNPDEVTLAEILKERGYTTACVGKWHLGHLAPFSPRQHSFDAFYGMMFPNDMKPFVVHRDETVIEPHHDQKTLTEQFTEGCEQIEPLWR